MTNGIALGNHATLSEAKERISNQKKRLKYVIKLNKLKVKSEAFKFYMEKSTEDRSYPFFTYVDTPENKYDWIFQA